MSDAEGRREKRSRMKRGDEESDAAMSLGANPDRFSLVFSFLARVRTEQAPWSLYPADSHKFVESRGSKASGSSSQRIDTRYAIGEERRNSEHENWMLGISLARRGCVLMGLSICATLGGTISYGDLPLRDDLFLPATG